MIRCHRRVTCRISRPSPVVAAITTPIVIGYHCFLVQPADAGKLLEPNCYHFDTVMH